MAVTTAVEPQRHIHRRNVVEDMRYDGSREGGEAIAAWVRSHGGEAKMTFDGLLVKTQVKWARVPDGYWVGHGVIGQFWVISGEVHALSYDPADGPDYNAMVTRDQAAAMVVSADEIAEAAKLDDGIGGRVAGLIEQMRLHVHQLATTAEALR